MSDSIIPPSSAPAHRIPKDFPLNIHKGRGYWCKKVLGRVRYFGKVCDDPNGVAALEEWLRVKDYLLAHKEPPPRGSEVLTLERLAFLFLAHHEQRVKDGELNPRTYQGLLATSATLAKTIGRNRAVESLGPDDFRRLKKELNKTRKAPNSLRNEMQRCRSILKFAVDEGLIEKPVVFGRGFEKPSQEIVDHHREEHKNKHGLKMFEADDLRKILAACGQPFKAMTLLAINTGMGQSDLAKLPIRAVDLKKGWLDFARVKTAVKRRVPLWPETMQTVNDWLRQRPEAKAKADADLLFLRPDGKPWVEVNADGMIQDRLGKEFAALLKTLKLKRPKLGFYGIRHTVETIGSEVADQLALDAVMAHKIKGMGRNYLERIGDDRLRKIVNHIHDWLFAGESGPGKPALKIMANDGEDAAVTDEPAGENSLSANTTIGADSRPAYCLFIA